MSYVFFQLSAVENPFNWRVTRSLVSYVRHLFEQPISWLIEGSPDRWWVTSATSFFASAPISLKGHQIVGELRPCSNQELLASSIEGSPDRWWVTSTSHNNAARSKYWRVTRSLVSYVLVLFFQSFSSLNWRVTRSLVSYVKVRCISAKMQRLKGHQIVGELRPLPKTGSSRS